MRSGFSFDDREVLEGNPVVSGALPARTAFQRDYWHHRGDAGHYRPLATLTLRVDRSLYGDAARGYHATNVALHALVVALAFGLAVRLRGPGAAERGAAERGAAERGDAERGDAERGDARSPRAEAGIAAAALGLAVFAAHPALADSVAWISGRTSMLAAAGGLAGAHAVLAAARVPGPAGSLAMLLASALGVLAGLLGKEDAIVFAVVLPWLASRSGRGLALAALLGAAAGVGAYLALRAGALGSPWPRAPHAPLAAAPLAERLAVGGRAACEALRVAALPVGYPPSYATSPRLLDADAAGAQTRALLGWLWVLGLAALGAGFALRRAARASPAVPLAACGALLAALAALPVLQLVPAGELLAPRFLYLPLLFAAPLAGRALLVVARACGVPRAAPAVLVVALAAPCWQRAGVYADRGSYRLEMLRHVPDDVGSWNDLGLWKEERGDLRGAREAWVRATELAPDYSRAWSNLGRLALEAGELDQAERLWRRAVAAGPRNPVAHCNLGNLLLRLGRPDEAAELYREAARLAPGLSAAWRGLGRSLADAGQASSARAALLRALALDPGDRLARTLLDALESEQP